MKKQFLHIACLDSKYICKSKFSLRNSTIRDFPKLNMFHWSIIAAENTSFLLVSFISFHNQMAILGALVQRTIKVTLYNPDLKLCELTLLQANWYSLRYK